MGRRRSLIATADEWFSYVPRLHLRPRYCTPYSLSRLQHQVHTPPSTYGYNPYQNPKPYKARRKVHSPLSQHPGSTSNKPVMTSSSQISPPNLSQTVSLAQPCTRAHTHNPAPLSPTTCHNDSKASYCLLPTSRITCATILMLCLMLNPA
jgi:hypothetical protein